MFSDKAVQLTRVEKDFSGGAAVKMPIEEAPANPPAKVKAEAVESLVTDAVAVHLGNIGSSEDSSPKQEVRNEKANIMSEQEVEEVAKDLEAMINRVHGTEVKFNVSVQKNGDSVFSFQVVEKNTGKVLRQFPREDVLGMMAEGVAEGAHGVFFDHNV